MDEMQRHYNMELQGQWCFGVHILILATTLTLTLYIIFHILAKIM